MESQVTREITPTFEKLLQRILEFPKESFNKIPFEGSWTGGQVAEHLNLSAGTMTDLLYGNTTQANRNPEEKLPLVADVFLNFDTKLQSPDSIVPETKAYNKDAMIGIFTDLKAEMEKAASDLELSLICEDLVLPNFGKLTRVEWIAFVIYHIQRHTWQMENIMAKV